MLISRHKGIGYAVLAFFLIMAFWNGIVGWMLGVNAWLIGCEDKTWLCVLLGLCSSAIVLHIINTLKQGLHFHSEATYWLYLVLTAIIYLRLRFDGHFDFYTLVGKIAWADILVPLFIIDRALVSKERIPSQKEKGNEKDGASSIQQEADNAERIKQDIQIILDKPINDEKEDLMKYGQIAAHIYNNLMLTDVSEKALSVGIIGDWGQGKSSMLNFLKSYIEKHDGNVIVEFNPRNSLNVSAIQSDFFELFSKEVTGNSSHIRIELAKYAKAVLNSNDSWIASLLCAVFPKDEVKRKDINKLIKNSGLNIFVIIDDFDRLTAKEIIEVLKLIDCNANFVHTYFITAFDKSYVDEVMRNYLHTSKSNFSDKYFDYEYYLPVVNQNNLLNYMNIVLKQLQLKGYEVGELMKVWSECGVDICNQLGTLRNLKRYLNLFFTRYFIIWKDINAQDYLYVTLLRYKDVSAYNGLLDGTFIHPGRRSLASNSVADNTDLFYLNDDFEAKIKSEGYWENSNFILKKLFPITKNVASAEKDYYKRIQSIRFFDKYIYDYQSLILNQGDLRKMIEAETDDKAKDILETLSETNQYDVKFFLVKELQDFRKSNVSFTRLFELSMAYIAKFPNDIGFEMSISSLLDSPTDTNIIFSRQFKTTDDYRTYWQNNLEKFSKEYPYELSHVLQLVYNNQNPSESEPLFTTSQLHNELLKLQDIYLKKARMTGDFYNAFLVSQIYSMPSGSTQTPRDQAKYDSEAVDVLFKAMDTSQDAFIDIIINMQTGGEQLQVWLDHALMDIAAQYPTELKSWLHRLNNEAAKDIITWLDEEDKKECVIDYSSREKPSLQDLRNLLKASYKEEDSKLIFQALNDEHCYDIAHVKQWLCSGKRKSLHNDIHSLLIDLYDKKEIGEFDLRMKEEIEPFEPLDLVMLDSETAKDFKQSIYKIWEVATISGDTYHLKGLNEPILRENILPIYTGSNDDKNIYYDSVQAGSVIGSNDPKPVHHIEHRYYMDQFKNDRIISALISNHNCQFVHEVQHVLRANGFDGQLKVKPSQT